MSKPMSEQMQKLAARYEKATGKKFNAKTNAQKIRSMTDEELAELFEELCYDSMAHCQECLGSNGHCQECNDWHHLFRRDWQRTYWRRKC